MAEAYSSGVAFIMEGDTEKVFYHEILKHFCAKHDGMSIEKQSDSSTGEISYVLSNADRRVLIKFYVVGTISQVANSGTWFEKRCYSEHKSICWTVFLCYDTDSYLNNVSKFYEGDWKELRKLLTKNRSCSVVDLAAQADIEDIMLLDSDGVFNFLGIDPVPIPSGSKGKRKMKKLFRLRGPGSAYHEGNRAMDLICALDMDKIVQLSPVPLYKVEEICCM